VILKIISKAGGKIYTKEKIDQLQRRKVGNSLELVSFFKEARRTYVLFLSLT
jgi:hypothetical protein